MIEPIRSPLIYLDSMVFIYAVEEDAINGPPARKLLSHLQKHAGAALTSELSLAEVLAPNKRRGKIDPKLKRAYLELIVWDRRIRLEPISRSILYETAELRMFTGMKLPDAIHVATAIQTACKYLVTLDTGMRVPDGMIKVEPTDAGVNRIREALT
jgi:predicted nucleic acid-binding protein